MKQEFKRSWKRSVQARKQRKYRANAPLHLKGKFLGAPLAKDLQKELKVKTLRIRAGDEIEVLRGDHKNETGRVERVNIKREKVYVNGIERVSPTGSKTLIALTPSNLRITKVAEDEKRVKKK